MKLISWETHLGLLKNQPREFIRRFRWPLVILLVGAFFDALTTYQSLKYVGPMPELHIPQRWVSQLIGVSAGVPIAKIIQIAFAIFVAALWRKWTAGLMVLCGLLYSLAALSNHYAWIR